MLLLSRKSIFFFWGKNVQYTLGTLTSGYSPLHCYCTHLGPNSGPCETCNTVTVFPDLP